jgi:nucleoside-diphosphate-sugar epimerase
VGSAFARTLGSAPGVTLRPVVRETYAQETGRESDVVIDCSGNSRKYLAEERPTEEFALSVTQRLRTLHDFPARLHVHISSADVYGALHSREATREDAPLDPARTSNYGLHKQLAEELVRHYADRWLILRLAGMVGPGLKKNPVHDVLQGLPLRIHPDSRYQFLHTDDVARLSWGLIETGRSGEIFNVCGEGLISPAEVARLLGRELDLSQLDPGAAPRIVDVSVIKLQAHATVPATAKTITEFVNACESARVTQAGPGPGRA